MAAQLVLTVQYTDGGALASLKNIDKLVTKLNGKTINIGSSSTATNIQGAANATNNYAEAANAASSASSRVKKGMDGISDSAKRSSDTLGGMIKKFSTWMIIGNVISGVKRAFGDALTEMKAVDSELVIVKKVTGMASDELERLGDTSYDVASKYGKSASQYLSSVSSFARAGYDDLSTSLAELSLKTQIVGDMDQKTADQFLLSVDAAYKYNGSISELSKVLDGLNEIDNNFATSITKVAEGLGAVAPVAAQAHVSVGELSASIGTITAVTQRSGSEAARALRALFLNIVGDTSTEIEDGVTWTAGQITDLRDVLKTYSAEAYAAAEATGAVVNPMEVIAGLSQAMDDGLVTEQKLFELVSKTAGKLRASQLLALVQNPEMYQDMLATFSDSVGSADKEVEAVLGSWESKVNILSNTWTQFVAKTVDTNWIKGLLDGVTGLIEGFGSLGTVIAIAMGALVATKWTSIIGGLSTLGSVVGALPMIFSQAKGGIAGFDAGMKALNLTLTGTQLLIGAVVAAISLLVIGFNKVKAYYAERRQDAIDAGASAAEEASSLFSLYQAYASAKTGLDETEESKSALITATNDLTGALGMEQGAVTNLSGSYDTLSASIDKAAAKKLESDSYDTENAVINAAKNLEDALKNNQVFGMFAAEYLLSGMSKVEAATRAYEDLRARREELSNSGEKASVAYREISAEIDNVKELIEGYDTALTQHNQTLAQEKIISSLIGKELPKTKEGYDALAESVTAAVLADAQYIGSQQDIAAVVDEMISSLFPDYQATLDENTNTFYEQAAALGDLTGELQGATAAIKAFQDAEKAGEKGDTFKSYADMYAKAQELYAQGLFGSDVYRKALTGIFGEENLQSLFGYDLQKAGEALGSDFFSAMFSGKGEDYGANAANYIKSLVDSGDILDGIVSVVEGADGTFGLVVNDASALAEELRTTEDVIWAMIDALDIFSSDIVVTENDARNLVNSMTEGVTTLSNGMKQVNIASLVKQLRGEGKDIGEIQAITDAVRGLSETGEISITADVADGDIPDLVQAIDDAKSKADEGAVLVVTVDEAQAVFALGTVEAQRAALDGSSATIYVYTVPAGEKTNFGGRRAYGVKNSSGQRALVNDGVGSNAGPELITQNGKAFIAGGGMPTMVDLYPGASVYTAQETKKILSGSGSAQVFGAYAGGITLPGIPDKGSVLEHASGSGYVSARLTKKTLDQLEQYISDILKKAESAKDAQIDTINAQMYALKYQKEAQEAATELEESRLELLRAEQNLLDANVERTVRYFNATTNQWEWMADKKLVLQAQEELADAQKGVVEAEYDALVDLWDTIKESLSDSLEGKSDIDITSILGALSGTAQTDVQGLLDAISSYTSNPASNVDLSTLSSFDSGGIATGRGYMPKNSSGNEVALAGDLAEKILAPRSSAAFSRFADSLGLMFGISQGMTASTPSSLMGGSNAGNSNYGNTYINGVQIGSDMMNKPLSEVLGTLGIYARG